MNVPAEKVWSVLDDFGGVEKFSVGVEHSSIVGEKSAGLGAKRHCIFYDKSSVLEEIIESTKGKSFNVPLSESSMPLKFIHAEF